LKADHFFMRDFVFITGEVKEVNAGRIRRVTVSDKRQVLIGRSGSDGFVHSDGGGQGITRVIDVVGGYFTAGRGDEKERIVLFTRDFDIGFISDLR